MKNMHFFQIIYITFLCFCSTCDYNFYNLTLIIMSCTLWKQKYYLHFVCLSVIIVCMCNILNRNSSKLYIHIYYHMYIAISIQNFDLTIFEGVIALFHLEYFIKKFVHATLTIHIGFTTTLYACLLSYEDSHIIPAS